MLYTGYYRSPLGRLLLAADEIGLTGLWFERQRYFAQGLAPVHTDEETPILAQTRRWLDLYFSGSVPDFTPPLHPIGSDFRQEVWALLLQIPYGKPRPTVHLPTNWPKSTANAGCPRRR